MPYFYMYCNSNSETSIKKYQINAKFLPINFFFFLLSELFWVNQYSKKHQENTLNKYTTLSSLFLGLICNLIGNKIFVQLLGDIKNVLSLSFY